MLQDKPPWFLGEHTPLQGKPSRLQGRDMEEKVPSPGMVTRAHSLPLYGMSTPTYKDKTLVYIAILSFPRVTHCDDVKIGEAVPVLIKCQNNSLHMTPQGRPQCFEGEHP
jgi:hypothetical protein